MSLSSTWILRIACSILLVLLVVPLSLVVVLAQQQEEENSTLQTSLIDTEDSSSLLTNYNALREEGQGFFLREATVLYANPGSNTSDGVALHWWCDFEFSSSEEDDYGYVGRAVGYYLGESLADINHRVVVHGEHIAFNNTHALSVSAVMVPTLGIFEGQIHDTQDDWVGRYWDDGSLTLPFLGWRSAWSGTTTYTKISTDAAAVYLGMKVADLTPATCRQEYAAAWNASDTSMATKRTAWRYENGIVDIFIQPIGMLVVTVIGLVAVDLF